MTVGKAGMTVKGSQPEAGHPSGEIPASSA
jgi:hypothetical protein